MTRYYITQLSVEGFRGIKNEGDPLNIGFRKDAVNSIYAQNGIGKTSLFEAISYAIFNRVPKLEKLKQAENPDEYYINKFHSGQFGSIELEFSPDDGSDAVVICVKRDSVGQRHVTSPSGHTDPEAFLRSLSEDFTLVDYQKFFDFIDDSPLERGRTFSSLVGLTRFAQLRQQLDQASNTRAFNTDFQMKALETQLLAAERKQRESKNTALEAYQAVTGTEIQDLNAEEQHIKSVTEALSAVTPLANAFSGKDILTVDIEVARRAIIEAEGGEAKAEYQKILQKEEALKGAAPPAEGLQEETGDLLELAQQYDTKLGEAGNQLQRTLFATAKEVVEASEWDNPNRCPVCETVIQEPIAARMERLLDRYREADALSEQLREQLSASRWMGWLKKLEECSPLEVSEADRQWSSIRQLANEKGLTKGRLRQALDAVDGLEGERQEKLSVITNRKQTLERELPPSLVTLTQMLEAGSRFRNAIFEYREVTDEAKKLGDHKQWRERWQSFIKRAATIVGDAESRLATQRIDAIEATYQSLFRDIVRGGIDMEPRLKRSGERENVDLRLENFYGEAGISARAVLSESYKNAIAGSIFFAAAVNNTGPARFMILDDITSSFDGGHQFNLMEALRTKLQASADANGLQFILLSHDTLLEKYFDRTASEHQNWCHQKLQGAAPTGNVYASQIGADRLKALATQHLNAGQVEIGQPFVRQYLESDSE